MKKIKISTTKGDMTLELDETKAPLTVANFIDYAQSGHYEGTVFHRVISNFMIQGGGMDKNLKPKFDQSLKVRPKMIWDVESKDKEESYKVGSLKEFRNRFFQKTPVGNFIGKFTSYKSENIDARIKFNIPISKRGIKFEKAGISVQVKTQPQFIFDLGKKFAGIFR
jgi:hypothetical protein